ncbi:phage minor tail protein L [Escherichia coli]
MQDIHEETLNESVKSEQSPRVVLWEIDLTVQGGERYFFCNELNEKGEPVTWQGREYQAYPIEGSGFEMNGNPTTDIRKDRCSKCMRGCEMRGMVANFGGFLSINKLSQ